MPGQGGRDEVERGRSGMERQRWMEADTERHERHRDTLRYTETLRDTDSERHRETNR